MKHLTRNKTVGQNIFKRNKIIIYIVGFLCCQFINHEFIFSQTNQEKLELEFDIVETFDMLNDWGGTKTMDVTDKSDMPRKSDGSASIWNYYSFWGDRPSGKWIADFGQGTHYGNSGKSAMIDLANSRGPSRLGIYFGNGSASSGYEEIYIFWMVNIPGNMWPKSGGGYTWWDSWKLCSFSHGFTSAGIWNNDHSKDYWPYGQFAFVPHIKRRGYGGIAGSPAICFEAVSYTAGTRLEDEWCTANDTKGVIYDDWMGIEWHLKLNSNGGRNGVVEVWMYDKNGNATLLYSKKDLVLKDDRVSSGHKYNKIFLGGNHSGSYSWTGNMKSYYYVDDFIINKTRIGPKYFQIVRNEQYAIINSVTPDHIYDGMKNIEIAGDNLESAMKLELGNHVDKTQCSVLVEQQIVDVSAKSITFNCTSKQSMESKENYLFLTTSDGSGETSGFPVYVDAVPVTTPLISNVSNVYIFDSENKLKIYGKNFLSDTPTVEIGDRSDYSMCNVKINQIVESSSDTEIEIQLSFSGLDYGQCYLFVENSAGDMNDNGFEIYHCSDEWIPDIKSVNPASVSSNLQNIQLKGECFGTDITSSKLELCDSNIYMNASQKISQSISTITDSLVVFSMEINDITERGKEYYLFLTNQYGLQNESGTAIKIMKSTQITSRQEMYESYFDIVETFDQLQDWYGKKGRNPFGDVTDISDMPKKSDGSASIWNYYSFWGSSNAGGNWIADFGQGTRIGDSGKSAMIDLANSRGPSRLGLYFGNGSASSGYEEIYIFWMVNIPGNMWPKSGGGYTWWDSWKLCSFSHGFTSAGIWNNDHSKDYWPYGQFAFVPHIKRRGYGGIAGSPAICFETVSYTTGARLSDVWCTANDTKGVIYDDWMGIEWHLKLNTNGGKNGIIEVWMYDKKGNATLLYSKSNHVLKDDRVSSGHKYNKIFLGGNHSGSYSWTGNMKSYYYVDDFIINKTRIGPKYFSLLTESNAPMVSSIYPDTLYSNSENIEIFGNNLASATKIEIGNNQTKSNCTVLIEQQVLSKTETSIIFNLTAENSMLSKINYLFITTENGSNESNGFPVYIKMLSDVKKLDNDGTAPLGYKLYQNYPNPFNGSTIINYDISAAQMKDSHRMVNLSIYNANGQLIRNLVNSRQEPGSYQTFWDGLSDNGVSVSSGIYFYVLRIDQVQSTQKKLLYLK